MTLTLALFLHRDLLLFHVCVILILSLVLAETIGIYFKHRPSFYVTAWIPVWLKDLSFFQMPISRYIILLFFLIDFSFTGYVFQFSYYALTHQFIDIRMLLIPIVVITWLFTIFMVHCISQVIKPNELSCRVHLEGSYATVIGGTAKPSQSMYAIVRDNHGQVHHIQVKPEQGELVQYSQVLLLKYKKYYYLAVSISSPYPTPYLPTDQG